MQSMYLSNTSKPKRPACPHCNKKGISVWHTNEAEMVRDRNCRYCGYSEFQTYIVSSGWKTTNEDLELQRSYNTNRLNRQES